MMIYSVDVMHFLKHMISPTLMIRRFWDVDFFKVLDLVVWLNKIDVKLECWLGRSTDLLKLLDAKLSERVCNIIFNRGTLRMRLTESNTTLTNSSEHYFNFFIYLL